MSLMDGHIAARIPVKDLAEARAFRDLDGNLFGIGQPIR
jgi:hypothetical protein